MADLILPGDHGLSKWLMGWPSSPNKKPLVPAKPAINSPYEAVRRFNAAATMLVSDFGRGDLTQRRTQVAVGSGNLVASNIINDGTAGSSCIIGTSSSPQLFPRVTGSNGGFEFTAVVQLNVPAISNGEYNRAFGFDYNANNFYGLTLRYYTAEGRYQGHVCVGSTAFSTAKAIVPNQSQGLVIRSDASGNWTFVADGVELYSAVNANELYQRTSIRFGVLCFPDTGGSGKGTAYLAGFSQNDVGAEGAKWLSKNLFSLLEPANDTPFLISVPAGGGAGYTETYAASASSQLALVDAWSLNYSETYAASAASSIELSESYATGYAETYAASAAAALALTDAWLLDFAETYGANASGDLALTDSWSLDYSEAYAVGAAADLALADAWALDYAETLTVTATGDLALSNAYAVGNNYNETFSVTGVAELSLTDVWAPHYGETLASDATAALALTDTWQLDYAETLAASAAAELLLSDAYDSPAPGAYDEMFSASAIAALDLTHLFTTPNALPPGINHLTARRVGGFFAVKP